ncbi:MAG: hypothetical protein ACR652_18880 [Methylocystis sp.]|uniref:hypothetical protein n=1 Tax=Methylocystis sp. TaxID=1911079 RepID=UPI003DA60498
MSDSSSIRIHIGGPQSHSPSVHGTASGSSSDGELQSVDVGELSELDVEMEQFPSAAPAIRADKFKNNLDEVLGGNHLQGKKDAIARRFLALAGAEPDLIEAFNSKMIFAPKLRELLHFSPLDVSRTSREERIQVRTAVALAFARGAGPRELDMLRKYAVSNVLRDRAEVVEGLSRQGCDATAYIHGLWKNPAFLKAYALEACV